MMISEVSANLILCNRIVLTSFRIYFPWLKSQAVVENPISGFVHVSYFDFQPKYVTGMLMNYIFTRLVCDLHVVFYSMTLLQAIFFSSITICMRGFNCGDFVTITLPSNSINYCCSIRNDL